MSSPPVEASMSRRQKAHRLVVSARPASGGDVFVVTRLDRLAGSTRAPDRIVEPCIEQPPPWLL
jgi:hypothetical protein